LGLKRFNLLAKSFSAPFAPAVFSGPKLGFIFRSQHNISPIAVEESAPRSPLDQIKPPWQMSDKTLKRTCVNPRETFFLTCPWTWSELIDFSHRSLACRVLIPILIFIEKFQFEMVKIHNK